MLMAASMLGAARECAAPTIPVMRLPVSRQVRVPRHVFISTFGTATAWSRPSCCHVLSLSVEAYNLRVRTCPPYREPQYSTGRDIQGPVSTAAQPAGGPFQQPRIELCGVCVHLRPLGIMGVCTRGRMFRPNMWCMHPTPHIVYATRRRVQTRHSDIMRPRVQTRHSGVGASG